MRWLTVIVYFAVVLMPVVLLGRDGPWLGAGDIDIRGRAPFPKKFSPGAFRDFDEWFADRIGLRYPLIYAGTELHIGLLRRPLDRHIFFGRDGWMFWTDDSETIPATMADSRSRLRYSQAELGRIDANIRAVRERFAQCGIPVIVSVVAEQANHLRAISVQRRCRGAGDAPRRAVAGAERAGALDHGRCAPHDARGRGRPRSGAALSQDRNALERARSVLRLRAIMTALARSMPIEHPETLSLDRYDVKSSRYAGGDMAVRVLFSPWRFDDSYVTVRPKVPVAGDQQTQVAHDHTLYRNPNGKGRLVVFGDTFVACVDAVPHAEFRGGASILRRGGQRRGRGAASPGRRGIPDGRAARRAAVATAAQSAAALRQVARESLLRRQAGEAHHLLPHVSFLRGEGPGFRRRAVQKPAARGEEALLHRLVSRDLLVHGG